MHSSESHQFRYARARCSAPKPMLAGLQLSGGGHCRTFLPTDFNRMGSTACASRQQLQTVDPFQTEDHGIRSLPQVYLSTGGFHFSSLLYMARCAFAGSTQFRAICKQEKVKHGEGHMPDPMPLTNVSNSTSPNGTEFCRPMPVIEPAPKASNAFAAGMVRKHTARKLRQVKSANTK